MMIFASADIFQGHSQILFPFDITNSSIMQIKLFFTFALLATWVWSVKITVDGQINLQKPLILTSQDAIGPVKYEIEKLPAGVKLQQNLLFVENGTTLPTGYYFVKVRVEDSTGKWDQKIVVIQSDQRTQTVNNSAKDQKSASTKTTPSVQSNTSMNTQKGGKKTSNSSQSLQNQIIKINKTSNVDNIKIVQLNKDQVQSVTGSSQLNIKENNKNSKTIFFIGNLQVQPKAVSISSFQSYNSAPQLSSRLPNIVPQLIQTSQASTSLLKVKQPSKNQIRTMSAFDRQVRAEKAVANLLSLVQKATANKKAALVEVASRQQAYKKQKDNYFQQNQTLQQLLFSIQRDNLTLQSSTQYLSQSAQKLQNMTSELEHAKSQKQILLKNIQISQFKLNNFEKQIQRLSNQYTDLNQQREKKGKECYGLQTEVGRLLDLKDERDGAVYVVRIRMVPAKKQLEMNLEYLQSLKKQIQLAEKRVQDSINNVKQLETQQARLNGTIKGIMQNTEGSKSKLTQCKTQLQKLTKSIQSLQRTKLPQLSTQKSTQQSQISILLQKIQQQSQVLLALPPQISQLKNKHISINNSIPVLQKQIFALQQQVTKTKFAIVDAKDAFTKAKLNLDAAAKRFVDQQAKVDMYTRNLELARVEKASADEAVNEALRENANVGVFPEVNIESGRVDSKSKMVENILNNLGSQFSIGNQIDQGESKNKSDTNKNSNSTNSSISHQIKSLNPTASQKASQLQALISSGGIKYINPNPDNTYTIKNMPEFILYFFGPSILAPQINTDILLPIKFEYNTTSAQINKAAEYKPFPNITNTMTTVVSANKSVGTNGFIIGLEVSIDGFVISVRLNKVGVILEDARYFEVELSSQVKGFRISQDVKLQIGSRMIARGLLIQQKTIKATMIFITNS